MLNKYAYGQVYRFDNGKWWEEYKQYFENIHDIITAYKTEAPAIRLLEGKKIFFKAKDKMNRIFNYEFKGFINNNSLGNIELFNIDLKESTIVEFEWFNQREISAPN